MSLGPVRLCSSSTLNFFFGGEGGGGFISKVIEEGGETPKEEFCKASKLFLSSRGFKSAFGGAPGEGERQRKKFMWPFSL